jgi:hypothetical protein
MGAFLSDIGPFIAYIAVIVVARFVGQEALTRWPDMLGFVERLAARLRGGESGQLDPDRVRATPISATVGALWRLVRGTGTALRSIRPSTAVLRLIDVDVKNAALSASDRVVFTSIGYLILIRAAFSSAVLLVALGEIGDGRQLVKLGACFAWGLISVGNDTMIVQESVLSEGVWRRLAASAPGFVAALLSSLLISYLVQLAIFEPALGTSDGLLARSERMHTYMSGHPWAYVLYLTMAVTFLVVEISPALLAAVCGSRSLYARTKRNHLVHLSPEIDALTEPSGGTDKPV